MIPNAAPATNVIRGTNVLIDVIRFSDPLYILANVSFQVIKVGVLQYITTPTSQGRGTYIKSIRIPVTVYRGCVGDHVIALLRNKLPAHDFRVHSVLCQRLRRVARLLQRLSVGTKV